MQTSLSKKHERGKMAMTVAFAVICIVYLLPILIVLMNSFKSNAAVNMETFALPNADSFVGFQNYVKGMTFGNYPFVKAVFYSLFITLVSSALILLCTSMAAWYVSRVGSLVSKIVYYLCVFSMVVPFQMVMFTLSRTANKLHLDTPWTIPVIYLGFGAGLAVFMFSGFVKSIPLEIEEAAAIDGASKWQQILHVTLPNLRTMIAILFILNVGKIFNADFGLFWNVPMQNGALFSVTQVIDTYIYRVLMNTGNIGQSTAAGLLQNIVGFICIIGANAVVKKIDSDSTLF